MGLLRCSLCVSPPARRSGFVYRGRSRRRTLSTRDEVAAQVCGALGADPFDETAEPHHSRRHRGSARARSRRRAREPGRAHAPPLDLASRAWCRQLARVARPDPLSVATREPPPPPEVMSRPPVRPPRLAPSALGRARAQRGARLRLCLSARDRPPAPQWRELLSLGLKVRLRRCSARFETATGLHCADRWATLLRLRLLALRDLCLQTHAGAFSARGSRVLGALRPSLSGDRRPIAVRTPSATSSQRRVELEATLPFLHVSVSSAPAVWNAPPVSGLAVVAFCELGDASTRCPQQ